MSHKTERDIVLFLGAGFSKEAKLPTMAEFGQASDKEGVSIEKHKDKDPRNGYGIFSDAYREFKKIQAFCKRAQRYVNIDVNNLETIFCMAEALTNANIEEMNKERYNQIKRWLWKICHQCPPAQQGKGKLAEPYFQFMDILKDFGLLSRTSVITTNYDLLFEYISWRKNIICAYPFEKVKPEKFRFINDEIPYVRLTKNEDVPTICKLHGSINFFEEYDNNQLFILDNVVPKSASKNFFIGKSLIAGIPEIFAFDAFFQIRQQRKPDVPAIVPPTYANLEAKPWLREMWNIALRSIQYAKYVIFIGYSIPQTDGFMYSMIQSAMALRTNKRALRAFIIDPSPSEGYLKLFKKVIIEFYPFGFGEAVRKERFQNIFSEFEKSVE